MSSITLTRLCWQTPEGHSVLRDLDMTFGRERVGLVGRNGVGKTTLLRLIAGELRPSSGGVSIGGSLGLVRQTVQVQSHATIADLFGIRNAMSSLWRAEEGRASVEELTEIDWTLEERVEAALARVGLDADAETPLENLSGGQRSKAGFVAAIFRKPDFLLLDEPTNNLDDTGRAAVLDLLAGWGAGAIVVSHDRELLDRMDAIVELTSLGATRYGGNWSQFQERKVVELDAAAHDLSLAEQRLAKAGRAAQAASERSAKRNEVGARRGARGDIPKLALGTRKNSAEATRGEGARLATRQKDDAQKVLAAARAKIEILQPLTVVLPSVALPANRAVLELAHVTAGYDEARPILRDISLSMRGPERVALVGPNGSGKTTLVRLITGKLAPFDGIVSVPVGVAVLDQSVSLLDPERSIAENFRRLNADATENACRATLASFRFRADAALQVVGTLSGGQMLRAGLACVLGGNHPPQLLILDEPTNHLDLDSVQAIEAGLRAYDGALIVISHDTKFLANIGIERSFELAAGGLLDGA